MHGGGGFSGGHHGGGLGGPVGHHGHHGVPTGQHGHHHDPGAPFVPVPGTGRSPYARRNAAIVVVTALAFLALIALVFAH